MGVFSAGLAVCRWLCEHYQHAESPSLIPSNPQDRHQMDMLIQQRQGLKNAGMDLLAGTTAR